MNMENENVYSTKDIYLASALVASNFELQTLEKRGKNFYFLFKKQSLIDISSNIDDFVNKYWGGMLIVDAKTLFSSFRELKNRIYNQ